MTNEEKIIENKPGIQGEYPGLARYLGIPEIASTASGTCMKLAEKRLFRRSAARNITRRIVYQLRLIVLLPLSLPTW